MKRNRSILNRTKCVFQLKANIFNLRNVFILILFFNYFSANTQVIKHPRCSAKSNRNIFIEKIDNGDKHTILSLSVRIADGMPFIVPSETYIIPSEGGEPLLVQKAKGINLDEKIFAKSRKAKTFELYFPKVPDGVQKINYRGGDRDDSWHFFEIELYRPYILNKAYLEQLPEKGFTTENGDTCRYIINPSYVAKSSNSFNISKIELCDTATILHFEFSHNPKGWVYIPSKSSIKPSNGGEVLYVRSAEGTNINEKIYFEDFGTLYYKLFFPPLNKDVKKIDFKELNKGGNWSVFELNVSMD